MRLLDSNVIIDASKPGGEFLHALVGAADACVSAVSSKLLDPFAGQP